VKRLLLGYTTALTLLVPGYSAAAPAGPAAPMVATALSAIRIDNFGRINENYYRGAQPQGRDYATLAAAGIKAIIDLTGDDSDSREPALAKAAGLKFFKVPMNVHRPPTANELAGFLGIVDDPANQPVYVHCVGGKHRTGVMTAIYRMTEDGWTADKAFREMKEFNFGADFLHPEFKKFVYSYKPVTTSAVAESKVALAKTSN
jgi:protein tyrosine/serine phosphatase